MIRILAFGLLIPTVTYSAQEPAAEDLIKRHDREKSAVWADGDKATFFFRGDAEQVMLILSGEGMPLRRFPDSDVWTVSVNRPHLARGVFSYAFSPGKRRPAIPARPVVQVRGLVWPARARAPAVAKELKGVEKTHEFDSKNLGEKRKIKIYLPPGHDRTRSYPVIFAADGMTNGEILEPLILAGKLRPLIVVGVLNGPYQGDRAKPYDIKADLRACEYLPGVDDVRFAKHEKFFCEEVRSWAETELGASKLPEDRAVQGVSNGGRFAVEMGMRHPELFGHVFGFSVAATSDSDGLTAVARLKTAAVKPPRFYLAAGKWEPSFHRLTSRLAGELKKLNVPVEFASRVSGHDDAMWRQELVSVALTSFGTRSAAAEPR